MKPCAQLLYYQPPDLAQQNAPSVHKQRKPSNGRAVQTGVEQDFLNNRE